MRGGCRGGCDSPLLLVCPLPMLATFGFGLLVMAVRPPEDTPSDYKDRHEDLQQGGEIVKVDLDDAALRKGIVKGGGMVMILWPGSWQTAAEGKKPHVHMLVRMNMYQREY